MSTQHSSAESLVADLPQGQVAYRAAGPVSSSRPPVVFVHGVLVDARLWEPVADRLAADGIRSYAPTLPLGAQPWAMNADADLSPGGMARLVLDFIAALGLSEVTLVGNDTGGAICQLVLSSGPGPVSAAVLTDCDAFEAFPPRMLAPLFRAMRHPGMVAGLLPPLRSEKMRHGPLAYGLLTREPLDPDLTLGWVQPLADKAIREDLARLARGVRPGILLDAAARFAEFAGPVRVVWGEDDAFFPVELGRRLSEAFPHGTLRTVPGGRTFLPLDRPDEVAEEIAAVQQLVP